MWFLFKHKKYNSELNGSITVGKKKGYKTIFSGGVTQSGGELVEMWDAVSRRIKKEYPTAEKILVLGVAGGSFIESLTKYIKKSKITGVELDPVMIEIYQDQFKKSKLNIKLINADAIVWIQENKQLYDVILVDLYIGRYNPKEARNNKFLINLQRRLSKKGVVVYNSHFDNNNLQEFNKFKKLSETIFNSEIIFEFPLNKVLLLTQRGSLPNNLKNKL